MMLKELERQPTVNVGLLSGATRVRFAFDSDCLTNDGRAVAKGAYEAVVAAEGRITVTSENGQTEQFGRSVEFRLNDAAGFTLRAVTIGIDFHWQRQEDQTFAGGLVLRADAQGRLTVINKVAVEDYLTCVIASEMSATAHLELLKAHALISRSWLLAQLAPWKAVPLPVGQAGILSPPPQDKGQDTSLSHNEWIRWYDRENHADFDICADDHCQRYQGLTKVAGLARNAIAETRGVVLSHAGALCDARFSKACGGFTELFSTAWADADVPYLQAFYDGPEFPARFALPLTDETNAAAWIRGTPPAFCATPDQTILARILPDFDRATTDFYRWRVTLEQDELQALLQQKLGLSFGALRALEPVERGASGRLKRLRLVGAARTLVIGKELEIRRALSKSHLYSSAFVITPDAVQNGVPARFTLHGAGWGHGVGLCQIGAALMAEQGYTHQQILRHYYPGAELFTLYQ